MARLVIGVNAPQAVKRWSNALATEASTIAYWDSRFMGLGGTSKMPIQRLDQLESDAGEMISFDLIAKLRMAPIYGDDVLEGKEERQRFYTDTIYIDQVRGGVDAGGRMTRKKTIHDLRATAKMQHSAWWAQLQDEFMFMYLSGARGSNEEFIESLSFNGFAGNTLKAPSANHHLFGGSATGFNNIAAGDKFSLALIDKAKTKAIMQGGGASGVPALQPCSFDGNTCFVCVMSELQASDLRANTATGGWLDLTKAAAAAEGRNNPLFKGGMYMHNGVVLHSHKSAIRFNNAGAGSNVNAARALFMGAQAGVIAYGSPGTGQRFQWHEETKDHGNQLSISSSSIFGIKKTRFKTDTGEQDLGVFALDTAVDAI